jgi:hypothetical protein
MSRLALADAALQTASELIRRKALAHNKVAAREIHLKQVRQFEDTLSGALEEFFHLQIQSVAAQLRRIGSGKAFCPTGPGGGIDNSCAPNEGSMKTEPIRVTDEIIEASEYERALSSQQIRNAMTEDEVRELDAIVQERLEEEEQAYVDSRLADFDAESWVDRSQWLHAPSQEEWEEAVHEVERQAIENWHEMFSASSWAENIESEVFREYAEQHSDEPRFNKPGNKLGVWGKDNLGDRVFLFRTNSGNGYRVWAQENYNLAGGIVDGNVTHIGFSDANYKYGVTGAGSAREVFRNVVKSVVALIKEKRYDVSYFSAREESRQKLYDRLVKSVAHDVPGYRVAAMNHDGHRGYVVAKAGLMDEIVAKVRERWDMEPMMLVDRTDLPGQQMLPFKNYGTGNFFMELKPEKNPKWFYDDAQWESYEDRKASDPEKLASRVYKPAQWKADLIRLATPPMTVMMLKALLAQQRLMGVNTAKISKGIKNCGTGAGGFQEGNTCARGGGESTEAYVRDTSAKLSQLKIEMEAVGDRLDAARSDYEEVYHALGGTHEQAKDDPKFQEVRERYNAVTREDTAVRDQVRKLQIDLDIIQAGGKMAKPLQVTVADGVDVHPAVAHALVSGLVKKPWGDESPWIANRYAFVLEKGRSNNYGGEATYRFRITNKHPVEPVGSRTVLDAVPGRADHVYRGMSAEEWEASVQAGQLQSLGTHNLEQEGLTFYGSSATAEHYSTGFSPFAYQTVPGRDGVVIEIPRKLVMDSTGDKRIPGSEFAHAGAIPITSVTARYELRATRFKEGMIEAVYSNGRIGEGSRTSPGVSYVVLPVEPARMIKGAKSTASDWLYDMDRDEVNEILDDWLTRFQGTGIKPASELPAWMKNEVRKRLAEVFLEPYWNDINVTTLHDLEGYLAEGITEGHSIRTIAENIQELGGEYTKARARNIARTESGNALNAARVMAADHLINQSSPDEPPLRKVWMSILSETTRDAHADLDGVPDDNGLWDLNGIMCRWPGDVNLPASDRCNCQCTVLVEFGMSPEDADALLRDYEQRVIDREEAERERAKRYREWVKTQPELLAYLSVQEEIRTDLRRRAFCPTGPGGGIDNSCSPNGGGSARDGERAFMFQATNYELEMLDKAKNKDRDRQGVLQTPEKLEKVKPSHIVFTQKTQQQHVIDEYRARNRDGETLEIGKDGGTISGIRIGGRVFVEDGHHRIEAMVLEGANHIDMMVRDLTIHTMPTPEEIQEVIEAQKHDAEIHHLGVNRVAQDIKESWHYHAPVNVIDQEGRTFERGGVQWREGGHCVLSTGEVTINSKSLGNEIDGVQRIVAHELMHGTYEKVHEQYQREYDSLSNNLAVEMRADGMPKQEFEHLYPTYVRLYPYLNANDSFTKLREQDGVTDYSKAYWKDFGEGKCSFHIAVHETLAEIAAENEATGIIPGQKFYRDFYKEVRKEYRILNGQQRRRARSKDAPVSRVYVPHVMYLDDQFRPTTADKAVLISEWTADGRHRWATRALVAGQKNCGTGAGGFQEGNTCARGGGGTSTMSEPSPKVRAWADKEFGDRKAANGSRVADNFAEWFGQSHVVNKDGEPQETEPIIAYHGTTHDFNVYDLDKANPENDMGRGFYFTESVGDAQRNYAGIGPDMQSKIGELAGRLESDLYPIFEQTTDIDERANAIAQLHNLSLEDANNIAEARTAWDAAELVAELQLVGDDPHTVQAYLKIEKPLVMGEPKWGREFRKAEEGETVFYLDFKEVDENGRTPDDPDFDEDTMRMDGSEGTAEDFLNAVEARFLDHGVDVSFQVNTLKSEIADHGGIAAGELVSRIKSTFDANGEIVDDNGLHFRSDLINDALREVGFDGIIYRDASNHFPGMGIPSGTRHFIVWESNRIKSADNQGTFDPDDPDITKAFCPTGPGGGIDNSCPPNGGGVGIADAPKRIRITDDKIEGDEKLEPYQIARELTSDEVALIDELTEEMVREDRESWIEQQMEDWEPDDPETEEDEREAQIQSLTEDFNNDSYYSDAQDVVLRDFAADHADDPRFQTKVYDQWGKDNSDDRAFFFKTSSGTDYHVWAQENMQAPSLAGPHRLCHVGFADGDGRYNITGAGNALEVFRTVTRATTALLNEKQYPIVYFSAAEPSRQKLYDRLVKSVSKDVKGYLAAAMTDENGHRSYVMAKPDIMSDLIQEVQERNPDAPIDHLITGNMEARGQQHLDFGKSATAPKIGKITKIELLTPEKNPAWFEDENEWADFEPKNPDITKDTLTDSKSRIASPPEGGAHAQKSKEESQHPPERPPTE